ncbi:MAG: asparagine synthase-related protein [Chloroflexota bacterium]|nr:asparagine synthase-related protein [Chloroflexota bacterium]
MPGLVGIVSINGDKINPRLMPAMRDAIKHRDWYEIDDYVNARGTVAISRVNLGIINKDKQPYPARNGRVKVFLHGEIYNDQATDSNPLEFIYRLYEKHGLDFASFLNGSFVVVIVDEDEDIVLVANDRIAAKPLFYFNDRRAVYFGPEMKSLLLVPALKRELNLAAVADFLTNGQFTREHTLIEHLKTVDSATVLKITPGRVTQHKYWEHPLKYGFQQEGKKHSQRYYQERLDDLLHQAISRRLRIDNTYGILLSGGYDSRGILGYYLQETHGQEIHTISWGREEDILNSDCAIAKKLAQKLGADHKFYKLTAEEVIDNFCDFILLGEGRTWFPESYDVFHRIREQQGVNIVLRGDEWLGSESPLVHDEHTMFRKLSFMTLKNIRDYQRILKPTYYQLFCKLDAETIRYISSRCSAKNIYDRKDFFFVDVLLKYGLNPLNYVKSFALESFTPLLDYDILDFVSTLPVKYRLDKNLYRKTVEEMFPELFEEVAQIRNDIDWATSFRGSPDLQRFVYQNLLEKQSILGEFIDLDNLKNELDAFFAPSVVGPATKIRAGVKTSALKLLEISPAAYNFAHKCSYYAQKWRGNVRDYLPPENLIIRLLILKVWGDVFLDYPVVSASG